MAAGYLSESVRQERSAVQTSPFDSLRRRHGDTNNFNRKDGGRMVGRLEGKVAFITGAARGQGRDQAVRLAQEGAAIIAVDIAKTLSGMADFYPGSTEDDLAETVRQVEAIDGRIFSARADVRNFDELSAALDQGVAEFGRLDIVSATAGVLVFNVPAHELTEERWDTVMDTNAKGEWHTAKAAIPHLLRQGQGGSIILNSSTAGHKGALGGVAYVASKHAIVGIMRTLALELAPHFIRVNTVHPTGVPTPMIQNDLMYRTFKPDLENPTLEDSKDVYTGGNAIPIPWVEFEDISNAVLYLASDESRYVTGTELKVDAGFTIK